MSWLVCEEARRVHHGAGAEQDAVAVDDEHAAVRRQRAEDLRRAEAASHAVEHDRRGAGLIEAHALVDADIELFQLMIALLLDW